MDDHDSNGITRAVASFFRTIPQRLPGLRQSPALNCVALALLATGVGLISLLLGATVFGMPMFRAYFASTMVIALNLLPPLLLIFLVYFACGRAWIAFLFPSLFILAISMIHFFKVQIRGDPLAASDYAYMFEAGSLLTAYTLTMNWKISLAIAALVCGAVFSAIALRYKPAGLRLRLIAVAAIFIVSAALYLTVYSDEELYLETSGDYRTTEWTLNRNFITKGFLYPFIHNIRGSLAGMRGDFPDWYDERLALEFLEAYSHLGIPEEKKVNIITIALEAYADLSAFGVLDFEMDIYAPLRRIQAESVSGTIVTNVFAGGTIDTERLFLTGNTFLTTFATATNSYVHYLKSQGYRTEGFHAGDQWFYDRRPVNTHLGFDAYYFLDDFEGSTRYDSFFFPTVLEMYRSRDPGKPYFSFNLSYQNHGAYDSTRTREPHVINQGGMSDESFNILNNYLSGIYDTTQRIEGFLGELRQDPDPVVVLFFGDHMPWLGNFNSVYLELGVNIDRGTEEGLLNFYSTPYFIWANEAARERLGNDFTGCGGSFSPGFLMGELFRLCSWEGEPYMQALRALQADIDIINTPTGMFRENGAMTPLLSPAGSAAFHRLRMIEIYRLNNFAY
jgi:phosphoglycerol transferase MdoB-like AlkP superfamily enzyme